MKLRQLLLRSLVPALSLAAQVHAAVIVPTASNWRWRPGRTEASTPVAAWRATGFADADFTTAPAPFWSGDVLPGGTQITGMQNVYSCIFLRKTFVVTNLAEIGGLRLGALVDDGFVAWINGTEVRRVNMPGASGSAVTTATLANNAAEPVSFTTYDLPAPPSYLVAGTNVLAVQVFQSSLGSSDLGFECSLESILSETDPPTVLSVNPPPGTITNLNQITVTFSEPVTGVAAAHLLVAGIGAASVTPVNAATYTFSFVQPPYGNVGITWNAGHNIADQALPPNRFNASGPGATWAYTLVDNTTPTIAALSPGSGATVRALNTISVLFSEPVSGVDAADLLINNTPAAGLTSLAASEYIFAFPEPPTGSVQVAWAAGHAITDQATAPNIFSGGNWTYRLDPNAADAPPYLSEFMASNTRSLADENGQFSDWIEIYNPAALTVNLDGWYLTDNANDLTKWRFPATNLSGGRFLIVFASGNDRRVPGARLHTSFQLSAGGEYLALVKPDGVTIASEFAPAYPSQVPDVSHGFAQVAAGDTLEAGTNSVYFTAPTPGAANLGGTAIPGPVIQAVQHTPNVPLDHQDLVVTAQVLPSFRAVASVTLRYRIMFASEVTTPMFDDGAHGDGAANDGVFGATIPANVSTNGQMIRYLVAATDVNANLSRWPLFTSPTATEEYLGTIVDPTNITSKLPIFHLFVAPGQMAGVDSENGGRLAFFYDGEFYDNIYMELRGNTSAGLAKKAHRLEFNRGHELRHAGPGGRTRRSSLLGEYLDPAYLRQHLCFWFLDKIGVPAPYDYPVRVQLNGQFYQLAFHNDVIGQEQVERMGYDPRGALYKAVGNLNPNFSSTGVFQKLEPDDDPTRTDYLQLANGINSSAAITIRRNTVFDLLDVPQVINHLAGSRWCSENDDVWANMSIYRDTFGDGLWRNIPFDMNASWGQLYGGSNPLEATVDSSKSHPLYGGSSTEGNFNHLYDVIVQLPETRQMLLRRQRSIMDQWIQPPGTPDESLMIENYIKHMTNLISVEANLDRARWGFSPWASGKTFNNGVGDLLNQFVAPRRRHWYVTHSITNTSRPIGITSASNAGIPLSQPANVYVTIAGVEFSPASGNQTHEYVCLSNPVPFAVDISGWQLDGGVQFTFAPGTVLPSNGVAYVSPDVRAFRARTVSPRGGQGLFILGPYQGQLSARGETLMLKDSFGRTLNTHAYTGAPSAAQQFLRVTELMFHPSALAGNPTLPDEFEYIEFRNISTTAALSLAGVRLANGVDFNFTGSAIASLAPGARVLVVKNASAFTARYGAGLPVAGQFTGNFDNAGERIRIVDANNEEILDFSYDDDWHPITDGLGFSLVVVDETAEPDAWDRKSQWHPSGTLSGSPGGAEPNPPVISPVLITEALSRTDTPPPSDTIELHNPAAQPADISGWWLTDDFNTPEKYRIPNGTSVAANGYLTFDESQFGAGPSGFALGSAGDEIWLFSADTAGNLTGYVHGHNFGAADDGVSFGRHVTSEGNEHFVAQTSRSLGAENSGPRASPVVINEIMYHPLGFMSLSPSGENSAGEYIELSNTSADAVPLFDTNLPANTWRLSGGVDFDFPPGVSLASGEHLLLVNFNPTNAALLSAFRAHYGVSADVRVLGPYSGQFNNAGEDVELKKSTTPVGGIVPFVLLDKVSYRDAAPWPEGADGYGLSLQRVTPLAYGNDPSSWVAAEAGAAAATVSAELPVITAHPFSQDAVVNSPITLAVSATGAAPLRYQWRFNGVNLAGATNSILMLSAIQPEQAGDYTVAVFNRAGSAVSTNASVQVQIPAALLAQPQDAAVAPGATVTFGVAAYSPAPLTYQWRFNGAALPGETNSLLTITNVQPTDGGDYSVDVADSIFAVTSASATLFILIDPVVVAQPLSQSVLPGGPVTLSVAVTNTATLPIGYRVRRNNLSLPPGPTTFFTLNSHSFFLTLTGTNAAPPWTNYTFIVTNRSRPGGILSAPARIAYVADTDADGLPDHWEQSSFGSVTGATASADPDNDDMTNLEEYIAGTDPTNASSYLKIDALTGPPSAVASFIAVSNRTYTVEFTDRVGASPWEKLADITARSTNRIASVPDPGYASNRVYRLVTPQQP